MEDHSFDVLCLVLHTTITSYLLLLLGSRIPGEVIEIRLLIEIVLVFDIINSIHKPPAQPVRIEKVLPLPGAHRSLI